MIVECSVSKDSRETHSILLIIKSAIAPHQTKAGFKRHVDIQKLEFFNLVLDNFSAIGVIPFHHYCTLVQPNECYITLKITVF